MAAAFAILLLALSVYYLTTILFLLHGLLRLPSCGRPQGLSYSVVIAAHNEERNIENCLRHVCAQTLAAERFEVILVDDRSSDATVEIASRFRKAGKDFSILRVDRVPKGFSPKKNALTQAIARAKHEIVVLTDADCVVSPTWLETIDRSFDDETGLVQGITTYTPMPGMGRMLFGLQAIDFLSHGIVSAAAIGAKLPLNANANNLAFRKRAFDEAGGYSSVSGVVSGDDDLLLQRVARGGKWKVRYMTEASGAVTTAPSRSPEDIFEQRKRWASKTVHYDTAQVALLGGIFAFYAAIVACLLAAIAVHTDFFVILLAMLLVKMLGECLLMIPGARVFRQVHLLAYLVPASFMQLPVVILAVVLGVFGRFRWKDAVFARRAR